MTTAAIDEARPTSPKIACQTRPPRRVHINGMNSRVGTQELSGKGKAPHARSTGRDLELLASRVAPSRLNVLITGETGTGKALLAKRVHAASGRADRPLSILTCAGLRAAAIERVLFGRARAVAGRAREPAGGMLAAADGGTLLLDEVAELPAPVQARLLRFLETGQLEGRGGVPGRLLDVRVLATSNRDLQAEVARGTFRLDLLSRLDGVRLSLPPLRERLDDIPALAASFLAELWERELRPRPVITTAAIATLQRHDWPGNLRELRNVIERAASVCEGARIDAADLMLPQPNLHTEWRAPASSLSGAADLSNDVADPSATAKVAGGPCRAALLPGVVLGGTYQIVRFIGSGSTGQVYEATHTRLNGRYAIKVLHPHRASDPKAIVRFEREAQIASGLQHANIAAILDFDRTDDGAPYLVMEHIEGRELARVIEDDAPMPIERVLAIVDQIASALAMVHQRNIVHRDLKPQNILLTPAHHPNTEQVKLVDFGISKVNLGSVSLTGERAVLGTPPYMAPEQAQGLDDVGGRADQFALAAVVHEMLTGRRAFPGDRVSAVVYRIVHEDPAPLGGAWGPALAAVLRRALAKDPEDRFPSILDFAAALRTAAAAPRPQAVAVTLEYQSSVEAIPAMAPPPARHWWRRLPSQHRTVAPCRHAAAGERSPRPRVSR